MRHIGQSSLQGWILRAALNDRYLTEAQVPDDIEGFLTEDASTMSVSAPATSDRLEVLDPDRVAEVTDRLRNAGVRVLRGTLVDSAGVIRAKQVPIGRAGAFHTPGLGAAPSWMVFCADDALAFTAGFSATGDMRLRADLEAVVDLGDGTAWAPLELADQYGEPLSFCPRGALRREQGALAAAGFSVLGATELEFVVVDKATGRPSGRPAYGISPLLDQANFVDDLHRDFEQAGVTVEQLHAEYGAGQFELSVGPAAPLAAADTNVLARILIGRAARRHGLAASFSPQPLPEDIGNGAHVHLSFLRDGSPVLSGGPSPHGLTAEGASIVGGLVAGLPGVVGALAPSALSSLRLQPGHWAGAFACWGLENREAAVRLCAATPGNPRGAHVEIKCVDPAANAYVAYALLLGLARQGMAEGLQAPAATSADPAGLSAAELARAGIVALGRDHAASLDALAASSLARKVLGPELLAALVAVRRHEGELAASGTEDLTARLRFAWSA
jgi:glutamine synthetase